MKLLGRSAGSGNFRSNYIEGFGFEGFLFSGGTQGGGAAGDYFVTEGRRGAATRHTRVKMDLAKPCPRVGPDSRLGFLHGFFRRQVAPWIGAQMIASQNQFFRTKPSACRDGREIPLEILRQHSGIATTVVDLVRSCLYQKDRAIFDGLIAGRLEHPVMRGADGVDSQRPATPPAGSELQQNIGHFSTPRRVARSYR